jgi:aminopeptidase N
MALLDIFSAMDVDVLQGWESILNGSSETGQNNEFYIHKSSAILMILNSAMGEDNFRKCLGSFLKVHQYQTALPDDLISTCSRKANSTKNISQMMNTWISNSGHPIVYLNKTNSSISIMQKPFKFEEFSAIHEDLSFDNESTDTTTLSPEIPVTISAKEAKKRNTKWSFPINYSTNVNYVQDTIWLDNTDSCKP